MEVKSQEPTSQVTIQELYAYFKTLTSFSPCYYSTLKYSISTSWYYITDNTDNDTKTYSTEGSASLM